MSFGAAIRALRRAVKRVVHCHIFISHAFLSHAHAHTLSSQAATRVAQVAVAAAARDRDEEFSEQAAGEAAATSPRDAASEAGAAHGGEHPGQAGLAAGKVRRQRRRTSAAGDLAGVDFPAAAAVVLAVARPSNGHEPTQPARPPNAGPPSQSPGEEPGRAALLRRRAQTDFAGRLPTAESVRQRPVLTTASARTRAPCLETGGLRGRLSYDPGIGLQFRSGGPNWRAVRVPVLAGDGTPSRRWRRAALTSPHLRSARVADSMASQPAALTGFASTQGRNARVSSSASEQPAVGTSETARAADSESAMIATSAGSPRR